MITATTSSRAVRPEAADPRWAFLSAHSRTIARYARKFVLGTGIDAEDFESELRAYVAETFGSYDPARSAPSTWLWLRAQHVRRTLIRGRSGIRGRKGTAEGTIVALDSEPGEAPTAGERAHVTDPRASLEDGVALASVLSGGRGLARIEAVVARGLLDGVATAEIDAVIAPLVSESDLAEDGRALPRVRRNVIASLRRRLLGEPDPSRERLLARFAAAGAAVAALRRRGVDVSRPMALARIGEGKIADLESTILAIRISTALDDLLLLEELGIDPTPALEAFTSPDQIADLEDEIEALAATAAP